MAEHQQKGAKPNGRGKAEKKSPSSSVKDASQPARDKPFHIAGIGASAGGLEAIEKFFSAMPYDSGMAFVIVQHLDPARHSSMPEIMSRLTKMPVYVATDGMKVAPNSVYLNPPDRNLGIRDGDLYLEEAAQARGLRLPVDFFLRSLAKERGANAIGIILSGTGSDGTLGLRAIKAELGTVFVQDPQSASYDGMPRSAVGTGLADFVIPPEEMPGQIIDFVKHAAVNGNRIGVVAGEAAAPLQQVFAIMRARTGHDFSRYKKSTFHRRLERRMSVNGIDNVAEYARFLRENEREARALLKDVLISVTSFFRDPEAFESLKEKLKGLLNDRAKVNDLRVWVAGCATGEEAYSVAMVISECLDEIEKPSQVQIYATDIDADALGAGRAGIYPANIEADVTPARLRRFFLREEKGYRVKKEIREMIVFAPQDFIKDPPFSRMDLICCRNLLIYLENDIQKKLLPLLHYALKPRGILFLGTSESVGDATDLFSTLDKKWKIFQRKETAVLPERLRFPASFAPRLPEHGGPTADQSARVPALAEQVFLDNYAPTFAVIDEKYRLVYVRGRTGKYLEIASGQPSLSITDMAREGLRIDLASAIYEASADKKAVSREGVRVKHNGGFQAVNLTVAPLSGPGFPRGLMMVVFQETGPAIVEGKPEPVKGRSRRVALVEDELRLTKGNLQKSIEELEAANEELKSANEELQSNNEELQSTNEELDTSREELQSLNEEMATVNSELSTNNEMLSRANDDLKNYLNRTDIAIVFLDENLNIRSYPPETSEVFGIRDVDIGRPLDEINSRLAYHGIVDDARGVLRTMTPKEIEVQRKDGHWYTMRVLPYLTVQNALGGIVMSFLDIDKQRRAADDLAGANQQLKESLEEVKEGEEKYQSLFENMTEGFALAEVLLDKEGKPYDARYLEVNPAWERIVGLSCEKVVGKTHREIDAKLDPLAVERFGEAFLTGTPGLLEYLSPQLGKWVEVNLFSPKQGHVAYILRDISDRKRAEAELAHLASFPELNPDPILELDATGNALYLNPAAKSLFPDLPAQGKAHPFLAGCEAMVNKLRSENLSHLTREIEVGGAWYLQTVFPGTSAGTWRLYASDITDRRKVEQLKDEFIGMVSHEMKTPLTVLVGGLHTLIEDGGNIPAEDRKQLLYDAYLESESLTDTVNNLLELTRAQANHLALERETLDIGQAARGMAERAGRQHPRHRFVVEAGNVLCLRCDTTRVEHVMYNLLDNAAKYSPEGSTVRAFARHKDGMI
ncbi:MAG: PAS domain-containing protein, partial [Chloroflexi bacterium]|nr:PAS domain-containing protein [Chloroflexota bacterium]